MAAVKVSRKGSLELSINAIVILILAITILGLGLGFIRGQWKSLEEDLGKVSDQMKEQIESDIRSSGKILTFNKLEISAAIGEEEKFYYGIKNTANQNYCFGVQIECVGQQQSTSTSCKGENGNSAIKGGVGVQDQWFTVFPVVEIESNEVVVLPLNLQISDADPDVYMMKFKVYQNSVSGECPTADQFNIDPNAQPYADKTFHLFVDS